ncbi:hypothetical protein SNE40_021221 [Patella caerulea]|uniref:Transposase n=1 Tax=Patella caerulea TaxID=87958 RepID=A0AAN8FZ14_PATCE
MRNSKAARKISRDLILNLGERTVLAMKRKYIAAVRMTDREITIIENEKRGRPLLLGDLDNKVSKHIKLIREAGGIVNSAIVIATARGIVKRKNKWNLAENGESLNINKSWAQSFLQRLGFVKCKGTKAARKLPQDFDSHKANFLRTVTEIKEQHNIPNELIFNFDQTGLKVVPVSNWTLGCPRVTTGFNNWIGR